MTITREQLEADKALCERAQTECLPVDRFACGNRLPEYIAELEATRERIAKLETERARWQEKADRYLKEKRDEDWDEAIITVTAFDIALQFMQGRHD